MNTYTEKVGGGEGRIVKITILRAGEGGPRTDLCALNNNKKKSMIIYRSQELNIQHQCQSGIRKYGNLSDNLVL